MPAYHCLTYYFPSRQGLNIGQLCQRAISDLLPGGSISIRDWLVPGSRLRGKKANLQREAGRYVNTLFAFAGAGYGRGLSLPHYQNALHQNGFVLTHHHLKTHTIQFHDWITDAGLDEKDTLRLKALLRQAPQPALEYLTPQIAGDRITFQLQEILIIGRMVSHQ